MIYKGLPFYIIFSLLTPTGKSQKLTEVGVFFGQSYYLGDLNPTNHFDKDNTHLSYGIIVKQPLNDRWAIKATYTNGKLSGTDKKNSNKAIQDRNLSFETSLKEISTTAEFNFLSFHSFVNKDYFSPYLFGGIGFAFIDPRAELNGNLYSLRELRTEGQNKPYNKTQFVIPFGLGFKFKFSHRFMFSLEYGIRKTFTDYIDDVSTVYPNQPSNLSTTAQVLSNRSLNTNGRTIWGTQRGNPNKKDFYTNTSFTVTIRIGPHPNLCKYNTQ